MGNSVSAREMAEKSRSDAIGRQLEEDSKRLKNEHKVLVLGPTESGKSTIVRQMKIAHQNGFTHDELVSYRSSIYWNIQDNARTVVITMREVGYNYVDTRNCDNANDIYGYQIDASTSLVFSCEIAQAIHQLWNDPIILKLRNNSEYRPRDNAEYLFSNVLRISAPDYLPTDQDILHAYQKNVGVIETRFNLDQPWICMIDVGAQCSERSKWLHCFEGMTSIIFCVALSDYDQLSLTNNVQQNRLAESLRLFDFLVNSWWFAGTPVILFLNKIDVFKTKLQKIPLERYFPEYSGGAEVDEAAQYMLRKFKRGGIRAQASVYHHLTQTTDSTTAHLISMSQREAIVRRQERGCDLAKL